LFQNRILFCKNCSIIFIIENLHNILYLNNIDLIIQTRYEDTVECLFKYDYHTT